VYFLYGWIYRPTVRVQVHAASLVSHRTGRFSSRPTPSSFFIRAPPRSRLGSSRSVSASCGRGTKGTIGHPFFQGEFAPGEPSSPNVETQIEDNVLPARRSRVIIAGEGRRENGAPPLRRWSVRMRYGSTHPDPDHHFPFRPARPRL